MRRKHPFVSSNLPRYLRILVDGVTKLDALEIWGEWEEGREFWGGGFKEKVNYVKKIFFSGSSDGGVTGKNARRMMMHLSIPIDEDLQQTLSFFEKIAARLGGLDMLGSGDAAFHWLIESFPRHLLLSLDPHVGVEVKDVGRMLIKYPWILSMSIQENFNEVSSFFELEKVPELSVGRAIRSWPHSLGCSTSMLKLMVEEIDELGIRNKMGQVFSRSPQLLIRKPQEFLQIFREGKTCMAVS
ncbi:hypothetical protein C1H46_030196 [Malus baccata]|uniref:Uncharacterized protein n=1 Tax=Malus baccata TaxID=106549 RepID=A0A540LCS1_MALBA|nr:hypothetical protein C1H46_030196 [Malus baccata]